MDSTGLFAAATIELNGLLNIIMAIDRENENYTLTALILFLIIVYILAFVAIKYQDETKMNKLFLILNGLFIIFFIVIHVLGKEIASLYFKVRPKKGSQPQPSTEERTENVVININHYFGY